VSFAELANGCSAEEFADPLLAQNARAVVVTRGARGLWLKARGEPPRTLRGFDVEAVDTTGAGDVFHGAFAHAVALGRGPAEAAEFAAAAAAFSCTGMGCRGAIPGIQDVGRMLADPARPAWEPAAE
jgi:sugar/nucleoside kinase (ribokinase family)